MYYHLPWRYSPCYLLAGSWQ